ncbi:DMT family transporter [Micromonospora sp. NPDC000207]|uniref:DMT family transporter n=1 Tax=Micromonospora sp. NPDC000207 TaxID=3154246 RepID=UPI003321E4B6
MRSLPTPVALTVVLLGGMASAAQGTVNAELGERAGNPVLGAVVNNLGGTLLVLVGLVLLPSMRSGTATLRRTRPPWWAYLGGVGGAAVVVVATVTVPVLGIAVFTITQVAGASLGGLAVDRAGLAAAGRFALTGPRLAGALLGVGAVALAQVGQPAGEVALAAVLLAALGGVAVAMQSALNGRLTAAGTAAAATLVNFLVSTPLVLAVAVVAGAFTGPAPTWPGAWHLYLGGIFGLAIVVSMLVGVRAVGVLRTGLGLVTGQLTGALLLDLLLPQGAGLRVPVLVGAALTLLAVLVAGRGSRPPAGVVAAVAPTAGTDDTGPVRPAGPAGGR